MAEDEKKPIKLNYPGNSHKQREGDAEGAAEKPQEKKVEKIILGKAVERKKPLGKKIAETFIGDDSRSVGQYILFDVMLPAVKTMISDAVSQGIERMLFGDSSRRRISGGGLSGGVRSGSTYATKVYSGGATRSDLDRPGGMSNRARRTHDFNEIVLENRGDAEDVLERLADLVDMYNVATVTDLYDLVGITGSYTDDKWGWADLAGSSVEHDRDGYRLNLPRPRPLD